MSTESEIKKVYNKMILYGTMGTVLVTAIAIFLILPVKSEIKETIADISDLRTRLKKQEILHPAYVRLNATNHEIISRLMEIESHEYRKFLNHKDILKLPDSFKSITSQTGLNIGQVAPDINSVGSGKKEFQLRLSLNGNFTRFHELLAVFEAEKKITDIESIEIVQDRIKNYSMKLRLNMDK